MHHTWKEWLPSACPLLTQLPQYSSTAQACGMQERELCASLRLVPGQYLAAKAALLRGAAAASAAGNPLSHHEARGLVPLEQARHGRAGRLVDLALGAGWVQLK